MDVKFTKTSREVLESRLEAVSIKTKKRRATIERMLRDAGCNGSHLTTQDVPRAWHPNMICSLPGEMDSVIVIGAHYDASSAGSGVADNWSGAILLPTLYESLKNSPRHHTFVFVAFAAEEKGLLGSRYYVKQLSREERSRIRAMVNMDTLGLSPTKVWVNRSDPRLVRDLTRVAALLELPLAGVNAERVGTGDHRSFRNKHIPCLVIHSVTQATLPILHSPRDNLRTIRFDDYYDTYVLLAATLAYLDLSVD